ncbi:hypothetical protein ACFVHT_24445, partial [Bacillus subtilis]
MRRPSEDRICISRDESMSPRRYCAYTTLNPPAGALSTAICRSTPLDTGDRQVPAGPTGSSVAFGSTIGFDDTGCCATGGRLGAA